MRSLLPALIIAVGLAQSGAAADWQQAAAVEVPAGQTLRGFGRVGTTSLVHRTASGQVWEQRFHCTGPQQAAVLAGKLLADLQLSPGVVRSDLAGKPAFALPGGAHLLARVDGAEAAALVGDSAALLGVFLADHPGAADGALAAAPYPAFLDRFERWGWGFYGMGGWASDGNIWNVLKRDDVTDKRLDPHPDVEFAVKNGFRFEPHLDPAGFDTSDGLTLNQEVEWLVRAGRDGGLPLSFRLYGDGGGCDWTGRRLKAHCEQPAPFLQSGWLRSSELMAKSVPHLSWFDRDVQRLMAVHTQDLMRPWKDEPGIMGWMHPAGELVHNPWYDLHDDYSATARASWRAYLQGKGFTLAQVSAMYNHPARPFAAWDEVPIPEFATFAGLDGQVLDLAGDWWRRIEDPGQTRRDEAWWKQPAEARYPGLAQHWYEGEIDPAAWQRLRMPGSDLIYRGLPHPTADTTVWYRRSFDAGPEVVGKAPLYLFWFPISHGGIHSGGHARFHEVFVNGKPAGAIGMWGALDVGGLIKAGANTVALHQYGGQWDGRIFLSTAPPTVYPGLGIERNRLWLTWNQWHIDAKYDAWRDILDGMRQVDPDRPIKFMAPQGFGTEGWARLAADWGGFPHFTGEGIWYYPWYKRAAWPYGLPATSETAGPADNLADQMDSYRRTFLAGLNGHDAVFNAQTYTRIPELRSFWESHVPVLKQMGRYDLAGEQVMILRDSLLAIGGVPWQPHPAVDARPEVQSPWNWDLGRGTFQTLGRSYIYLDPAGVRDGLMGGQRVMIDCGNEVMEAATVERLAAWVEAGGTFVAFPFTGRSTRLEQDSWPIRRLSGCTYEQRPLGGTVTFARGQRVFAGLAGRTVPDQGVSLDWVGNNLNRYSMALAPEAGSEVLATYADGRPAMVRRPLGRGQVIVLGSMCWRQAQDRRGLWWPEALETEFVADLLKGAGLPPAAGTTDDRLVWPQPYRSNNGLDLVSVLVSWHDDRAAEVTVRLNLPRKPASLTVYQVAGGEQPLAFTWADGVAVAKLSMPAKEVAVIRAGGCLDAGAALGHWWGYQQRLWRELAKPTIDFAPYRQGEWADPTVDLRPEARMTQSPPAGDAWAQPGFDDSAWRKTILGIFTEDGAAAGKPIWVRRGFTIPAEWSARGGRIFLTSANWSGRHYIGKADMLLNGQELHPAGADGYLEFDITQRLRRGENVVAWRFDGQEAAQGIGGNVWLHHEPPPERTLSLAGTWDATDAKGQAVAVDLPGTCTSTGPTRRIAIPKEWEGRYRIFLRLEGARDSISGAFVNDRLVRRHHHAFGERCLIDITEQLSFGADNQLRLSRPGEYHDPVAAAAAWNLREVTLELHPAR